MAAITATPLTVRPHLMIAEMESIDYGGRVWSDPMFKVSLDLWVDQMSRDYYLSDYCCSSQCWCEIARHQ